MLDRDSLQYHAGILYHIQYNLYPGLPAFVADNAMETIDAINENEPDRMIRFPLLDDGTGYASVAAWQIVENLHLEHYIY